MSGRQARIARKAAQREGTEAFVHLKPQRRVLGPVPMVFVGQTMRPSGREVVRRFRRYGADEALKGAQSA